jgi:hypothetical protein
LTLAVPLLRRESADCGREIGSSMPSNCSLRSVERADEVAGDKALSLEPIDTKGRRCYTCLGGIVVVVLILGF